MKAGSIRWFVLVVAVLAFAATAQAVSIDLVTVGDPGNVGEWSGQHYGGGVSDRICGAVDYTYNIGKYEVTAGQYTVFLNAVGGVDTYGLYSTYMSWTAGCGITRSGGGTVGNPYTYSVATDFANRPVTCVSWGDAARFANWLQNGQPTGSQNLSTTEDGAYRLNGARTHLALMAVSRKAGWKWALPSEDEWYKAAYYKGGSTNAGYWDFATRSDIAPGRDMTEATNPGNNANYGAYVSPYPIDSGKFTTLVGEFQLSASSYGTFDQSGNVWEWNDAVIIDPSLQGNVGRGMRGGAFSGVSSLELSAGFRYDNYATDENFPIGFRVANLPEPGTVTLLAVGGLCALAAYAWRRRWKRAA